MAASPARLARHRQNQTTSYVAYAYVFAASRAHMHHHRENRLVARLNERLDIASSAASRHRASARQKYLFIPLAKLAINKYVRRRS